VNLSTALVGYRGLFIYTSSGQAREVASGIYIHTYIHTNHLCVRRGIAEVNRVHAKPWNACSRAAVRDTTPSKRSARFRNKIKRVNEVNFSTIPSHESESDSDQCPLATGVIIVPTVTAPICIGSTPVAGAAGPPGPRVVASLLIVATNSGYVVGRINWTSRRSLIDCDRPARNMEILAASAQSNAPAS